MTYDLDIIKTIYKNFPGKIKKARQLLNRPLTITEKICYAHLDQFPTKAYTRLQSYVNFRPDRVAMQDATAQMALLQFMQAGKEQVSVPSTVHCDHLIQAELGAEKDLSKAMTDNKEVYDFLSSVSQK